MKKSHLMGAICACISFLSLTNASAGVVGLKGIGTGTFSLDLYDQTGAMVDSNTGDTWSLNFDTGTGTINSTQLIFGNPWFAHSLTFVGNGDGTYSGNMLVDYSGTTNIPVTFDWDIDLSQVVALDGDGDGIPGNAMTSGPFPGLTPAFYGTLTGQYAVPIPATAWLFGSGLLGMIGIARRKKAA
jgi:hypothetical protein